MWTKVLIAVASAVVFVAVAAIAFGTSHTGLFAAKIFQTHDPGYDGWIYLGRVEVSVGEYTRLSPEYDVGLLDYAPQ